MIHGDYRPKKCTHCPKAFKTQTQLTIHKLDEHNIDTRHKCNACDKVFNMKRQLTTHTKSYHMMGEKIKCSMCDYECYLKSVLRKHLYMHKTSKDFHCTYCKKSFMRKTTLQFHERIHTGDKRKALRLCSLVEYR
ncbi:Gonadotropin inducible transcription factor [Operophtera brumata]|uniref:Gonadotropin inducible transcription factor n=1 Tax=Operophtera brumata TaxID=104452 RepID=A0A0L7KV41_OPEBR|nr:Gonadotropin inducible transcription factor [Operophtera brumata]